MMLFIWLGLETTDTMEKCRTYVKMVAMVAGFQLAFTLVFCSSILHLHNIYLSSPLPALNNIACLLTTKNG